MPLTEKEELEFLTLKRNRALSQQPTEPVEPEGKETTRPLFGLPKAAESLLFPTTGTQAIGEEARSIKKVPAQAAEALTIAGRGIAALPALIPGGETFKESFKRREGKNIVGKILRDPTTLPLALSTGGVAPALKGLSALGKVATGALVGAGEGVVSAGIHQAEDVSKGQKFSPKEVATEIGLSAATGGVLPVIGVGRRVVAGKIKNLVGDLAEWTTGVSKEALELGGTKAGRAALKKAYGTQVEIGQKITDMIGESHKYMPDADKIQIALENSPSVSVIPFMSKLRTFAGKPATKEMQAVSAKILQKVEDLQNLAVKKGDTGFIRPVDMNDFRIELDVIIDDQFGKASNKYITALKQLRHDIQEEVTKTAKGTQYEKTMKEFSNKLNIINKMKKLIGYDEATRELRAESFVKNINNKGKTKAREWLADFEKVFGGEFTQEAKMAQLADMMGEAGTGGILPKWTTGRSLWAKGAGLFVGSPRIAAGATLPFVKTLTKETPQALSFTGRQLSRTRGIGIKKEEEEENKPKFKGRF
ncbi:MAG TPA: hypothetical protein VMW25_04845 [Clostridia bacterium]|nr:hypothetical protein [Clostridia bacterium]